MRHPITGRLRSPAVVTAALALAASLAGCVVVPAHRGYGPPPGADYDVVTVAPPAPQYEVVGVAPYPGWLWIGGYWSWSGSRHVWIGGRWQAPRPGYRWQPHRWEPVARGWREVPGRWSR
jgi:hypothetical protein